MTRSVYYPQCAAILSVVFDGLGGNDTEPLQIVTRPRSANVSLNGYNEADTFSLEFDARVLPIDPQQIRSAAVGIYMFEGDGLGTPDDWARRENQVIVGLVDDASLSMSEDGQVVSWSGRDYTALLLDIEWDPTTRVDTGRKLSAVIQSVIASTGLQNLRVVYESDAREPVVSSVNRGTKKNGQPIAPGKTAWDVIYETCINLGFIVYVDGEDLEGGRVVITEPRVQTEQSAQRAPLNVWGVNLQRLEISRRLGKERVPQIEAVTLDPRTGDVLRAKYPPKASSPVTGVGTRRNEVTRVTAPAGVTDRDTLIRFARTYYENLARTEAVYHWRSGLHLESVDGQSLLRLRAGDPVQIGFSAFNAEQMRQLSPSQRVEHMVYMGYHPQVAQVIVNNYERLAFLTQPYYTRVMTFQFSDEGGIEIEGEAVNYAYVPREEDNA